MFVNQAVDFMWYIVCQAINVKIYNIARQKLNQINEFFVRTKFIKKILNKKKTKVIPQKILLPNEKESWEEWQTLRRENGDRLDVDIGCQELCKFLALVFVWPHLQLSWYTQQFQ